MTRREYELTDDQLNTLLDACKPTPYLVAGGVEPRSPQENVNAVWESLGKTMGFDYTTVEPVKYKDEHFFTAVPTKADPSEVDKQVPEAP